MTTITQNIDDIAGADDNTSWTFYTKQIRISDSGAAIVSTKKVRKYPVAGLLTVVLDPGPAVVIAADGKTYPFTVPATDTTLWPLIQAAVTILPTTTHQQLLDAVDAWLASHTNVWASIPDKPAPLAAGANVANGYAGLDGTGKLGTAQLPISAMEYKGNWNASTNSPTLADGAGSAGDVYRVSTGAARNLGSGSITFDVNDYAIYNGTTWEKSDTTDAVTSVAGRTGAVTLTSADIALSTYDTTGATDGASFLQSALTTNPVVFLKPGSTLLLNSGVYLDSAAALGTGYKGTYIIDGQGSATIKLGSGLPTVPQFSPDTSRKWAIHLNTERTALSAGAVTHSDGTRTTGGAYPIAPRLIIRNCIIDGNSLNAGLVFGNTAATLFENCQFYRLMCALSWRGYSDGNGIQGGQIIDGAPSGSWLIDQIANGDGVTISDFKGLYYGVWRAIECNGGYVRNSIQGLYDLKNCNSIIFDGGHWEPSLSATTGVPQIKINNSNVNLRHIYAFASSDPTIALVEIDETAGSGFEYSSHVVIDDPIDVHYYQSQSDPAWAPYLSIKNINTPSTVELRRPVGQSVVSGLDLQAGASFHVSSADSGVQAAIADGRFASQGGALVNRNGTWEVVPQVPGLQVSRDLVAPNFIQATVADAGAVGTITAATYYYVMALLDSQGRYTTQSAVQNYALASTGAIRLIADAKTAPARLVVWRKSGSGVQTAPDRYAVLPLTSTQLRLYDTGTHIDGVSWITSSVPIPNTVAASNGTANTSIPPSALALNPGLLAPCQANTQGAETYTIVSGTVTQIAGLTVNLGSYTPIVGDRILIATAPTATGAGTGYALTNNPGNGIYVVTSLAGGNMALARSADMSGSLNPASLLVYTQSPGGWSATTFWTVNIPAASDTAFTWGTTSVSIAPLFGTSANANGSFYAYNVIAINALQTSSVINTGTTKVPTTSGVFDAEQLCTLTAAYTLTSQTAAQKLFNTSTNGAVTLPVGTYFFECFVTLSALNTGTSSIFGFALAAGTATIAGQLWESEGNGATLATAAAAQNTVNTAANAAIVAANTSGVGWAKIRGKVRISAAGTVIPQVSLNTAAAAIVGVDSFFRIWQVATSATATTVGTWT